MTQIVEVGQKYGSLRVIKQDGVNKDGRSLWLCLCDCGIHRHVLGKELTGGRKTACTVCSKGTPIPIGHRFGYWLVIEYIGLNKHKNNMFLCECECGNTQEISATSLRKGHTEKCVWCSNQLNAEDSAQHTKHYLYSTWTGMKARCNNPNYKQYADYGGRGITVCDRWLNSFEAFLEDMGERPLHHSIDRIDNDKGYTPDNCRWATALEQRMNNRGIHWVTYKGETLSMKEMCIKHSRSYSLIEARLNKLGWSVEKAFETP